MFLKPDQKVNRPSKWVIGQLVRLDEPVWLKFVPKMVSIHNKNAIDGLNRIKQPHP